MSRVVHVQTEEEWRSHIDTSKSFGGKAVMVDFFAEWCGPCKVIGPEFERLSTQFPNVTFLKVDVDNLQEVAMACSVKAMPTFQAYFGGERVGELVGADRGKLLEMAEMLNSKSASLGTGQKLGGTAAAPPTDDSPEARRARMLAAAEARSKGSS